MGAQRFAVRWFTSATAGRPRRILSRNYGSAGNARLLAAFHTKFQVDRISSREYESAAGARVHAAFRAKFQQQSPELLE